MGRYIMIDENKIVIATRIGKTIVEGEIEFETGEFGQIMQPDGTFIDPEPIVEPQPYIPNNAEIAQMISDLQADLLIAGVI